MHHTLESRRRKDVERDCDLARRRGTIAGAPAGRGGVQQDELLMHPFAMQVKLIPQPGHLVMLY